MNEKDAIETVKTALEATRPENRPFRWSLTDLRSSVWAAWEVEAEWEDGTWAKHHIDMDGSVESEARRLAKAMGNEEARWRRG